MSYLEKVKERAQRKLLALDGGGIRGAISIEILAGIEDQLRLAAKRPGLVLADYFDYVAGTSTGAIIATCISLGMAVNEIRTFYEDCGPQMFQRARLLDRLRYKFEDEPLAAKLKEVIWESTSFGDDRLQTFLMMVMRNATTDSPWPLSNNPAAKYNNPARADCNLKLPLWQLVRASTAAPTYFPPEVIPVGQHQFIFVDGGITMYNNPAFQLFLMATAEPYGLQWPTGETKMLLVSIGTGTSSGAKAGLTAGEMNILFNATSIPAALMNAALNEQDFLCRAFGNCLDGDLIDREIGDMVATRGPAMPKLFTYVRYNASLTREGLDALGLNAVRPEDVQKLDSTDALRDLQDIGRTVARTRVREKHFVAFPA